jgi:hypothetical protein
MRRRTLCLTLACAMAAGAQPAPAQADTARAPTLRWTADARPGYHGAWRTSAAGEETEVHDLRARIRAGVRADAAPGLELGVRAAGRLSSEQEGVRFFVRDHAPSRDGLAHGDFTLDEIFARATLPGGAELRAGRFQTSFELAGVPRKSLDRNDSPNTDVTWTDGAHLSVPLGTGVRQHLIVQHNARRGPTNTLRAPLDFRAAGSRASLYAALVANPARGLVAQRELGLTVLPAALSRGDGTVAYTALTGRGALRFPLGVPGATLVVAAEAGYAPTPPTRAQVRTGTAADGDADGRAAQLSVNLMNVGGAHSLGVVHGRTGDGWLLSPDIRPNNREWEVRYYWQYHPRGRLDARVRTREDVRAAPGSAGRRSERDVYLRTTIRL